VSKCSQQCLPCQPGEVPVIVHAQEIDLAQIYGLVVAAPAVIVADVDHFLVLDAPLVAVLFQGVGLVEGHRRHVKGGRAAHEHVVLGEGVDHILVEGPALGAVGIEGQLVRLLCFRAQQGEGHTAGGVVFHIVPGKLRVAVLFPEHGDPLVHGFPVTGQGVVENNVQILCFGIVLAVLHAVVAQHVDGELLHLIEDAAAHTGAGHQQLILFGQVHKGLTALGRDGGLVLGQCAVQVHGDQLDIFKFIKLACRIGFTCGEDVDLDFHIPYTLMIQLARDNGFEVQTETVSEGNIKETIKNVPGFLRWLNMHSTLPFLYKHRTLNGNNEFFIRMRNMYVHLRPQDLSADDGEREGQMTNNFGIEFSVEVRFPAPKMYAYYSDNAHKLKTVYGAWYQPNGPVSTCYTFKGSVVPDKNKYNWPLYMSTTYEDDEDKINLPLEVDFSELLEGDIGECIADCLSKGVSPAIFCDLIFFNGGEYITGKFDWETLTFKSNTPIRNTGTFIGVYVDGDYINDYVITKTSANKNRISESDKK